jgi:AraC-like DNA-binding protein
MNDPSVIAHGMLDTSTMAEERQFAAWAQHSKHTRLSFIKPGPFLAQCTFWDLGQVIVAVATLDPFASTRDRALIAADGADHVQIVCLLHGSLSFETDDASWQIGAPDLFVRDYAMPSHVVAERTHCIILYFERAFLQAAGGEIKAHGRLAPSGEKDLLRHVLGTITTVLPSIQPASRRLYAAMLRDLTAAALPTVGTTPPKSINEERRLRAERYISASAPGSLAVDLMERNLGLSRTTLYALFRKDGGVLAYDRNRRLRKIFAMISDPSERRTIAEIGAQNGFFDSASLARSFRTRFGCTLSEVRRRASGSGSPVTVKGGASEQMLSTVARLNPYGLDSLLKAPLRDCD